MFLFRDCGDKSRFCQAVKAAASTYVMYVQEEEGRTRARGGFIQGGILAIFYHSCDSDDLQWQSRDLLWQL